MQHWKSSGIDDDALFEQPIDLQKTSHLYEVEIQGLCQGLDLNYFIKILHHNRKQNFLR